LKNSIHLAFMPALIALFFAGATSHATFIRLDDFEGLTPGAIGGQNGWVANQTAAALLVATDPDDPSNQVLQVGDGTTTGNKTLWNLGIPAHLATDPATLLLRFKTADDVAVNTVDVSVGLTIQNPPGNNFNFQAQARVRGSTTINPPQLDARDNGAFLADSAVTFALVPGEWYNLWVVQDHPTDQYNVYLGGPGGGAPTLMFAAQSPLDYRVAGAGQALAAFFLRSGGGGGHLGPFYIDDVYVCATSRNLKNPVPEPATIALASLGGLLALGSCRRRKG
jgi:hypothetical protein